MIAETIRISETGRQQLIRLKAKTGIKQWNVLCRWALAVSLAEPSAPPLLKQDDTATLEIAWKVFAGPLSGPFTAAVRLRLHHDRLSLPQISELDYFHLHLHRGISYLASSVQRSIEELLRISVKT